MLIYSTLTSAALVLRNPAPFRRLSFLCAAGDADGTVAFTIRHEDGSTEPGTLLCPAWFHGVLPAVTAWGRVDVNLFVFNSVTYPKPALFSQDIVLTNTSSAVTRIEFQYLSGTSHNAIFAVSGALAAEDRLDGSRGHPIIRCVLDLVQRQQAEVGRVGQEIKQGDEAGACGE